MSLVSLYQQVEQQESIDIPSGWGKVERYLEGWLQV